MAWSRRFFDKMEWFHKLPLQIDETIELLSQRLGLKIPRPTWKIIDGYLYFSDHYWRLFLQPAIFLLPSKFFSEIKVAKHRWLNEVLPKYEQGIDGYIKKELGGTSFTQKLELLEKLAKLEAWLFAESLSVGVICGFTEILLSKTYTLFVKNSPQPEYHELLIGFPDKGLNMDSELWSVAQMKDKKSQDIKRNEWTSKYGYRIQDKDLLYSTLGEKQDLIDTYIKLYQNVPDPIIKKKKLS